MFHVELSDIDGKMCHRFSVPASPGPRAANQKIPTRLKSNLLESGRNLGSAPRFGHREPKAMHLVLNSMAARLGARFWIQRVLNGSCLSIPFCFHIVNSVTYS